MLEPLPNSQWSLFHAAHLLNRAGFGGTPSQHAELFQLGPEKAVDRLINAGPDDHRFPPGDWQDPGDLMAMRMEMRQARENETQNSEQLQKMLRERQRGNRRDLAEIVSWWLDRMVRTEAPLVEKMALFWHGHFATSAQKVRNAPGMFQQNQLFRSHGLGNFGDLTKAVTRDPAMMVYLDVNRSRPEQPNENFAREIMELFTLGEGHYTEDDIREAARAFTGYRIDPRDLSFRFISRAHDDAPKNVLSHENVRDGDDVVDAILDEPACSEFIAAKIWRFFASENPEPELVRALAWRFRQLNYDLRPFLRSIFLSSRFYDENVMRNQIKSPVVWLVNTCIILQSPLPNPLALRGILTGLGQVPLFPPNVKGWDGGRAWINSSTLLLRYNLAQAWTGTVNSRAVPGVRAFNPQIALDQIAPPADREDFPKLLNNLAFRIYQTPLSQRQAQVFTEYWQNSTGERSDARVRGLLSLMMASPEFQLI